MSENRSDQSNTKDQNSGIPSWKETEQDADESLLHNGGASRRNRRKWREWRFRMYTFGALLLATGFVVFFLYDMIRKGYPALWQAEVRTEITYTPETVRTPETAFPERVRDLVSPARIRSIQRTGQTPSVQLPVHYQRATAEQPEGAIRDVTLTKDAFPIYMQDRAPVEVPREHLLRMLGKKAMDTIRDNLQTSSPSETRAEELRGSRVLQQYMISMEDNPLPDQLKTSVEHMIKAGRVQMTFNHVKFSDQSVWEEWVVLDSDVDQYLKGHYSQIGFRAGLYRQLMDQLGRKPVADPDLDQLMSEIESAEVEARARKQRARSGGGGAKRVAGAGSTESGNQEAGSESLDIQSKQRLQELVQGWRRAKSVDQLKAEGRTRMAFNDYFFLNGDSSEHPEVAGMKSAVVGSVLVLIVVLVTAVPIGVMTSVYLEEFAPDNRLIQIIEININNLAAIPSILYGLLGLSLFINTFGLGRSWVLVGGLTLSLMTLPIVIISSRSALRSVPDSIRMAGFSMGATRWQVVLHHVLPESLTGILTGSIIGLAQAMGETAPLILIGMVGFFPKMATSFFDESTVMPAQIFQWWSLPHRAFQSRAALAILLLLAVLFVMNGLAVVLRAKTQETGS